MQGKIIEGILLARRLLIEKAVREDRELVVSVEGKVVKVKAKSLLDKRTADPSEKGSRTAKQMKPTRKAAVRNDADRSE